MHILDYSFQSKSFIQYFAISTECIGRLLAIPFVIHLDISMYIGTYINFDCAQCLCLGIPRNALFRLSFALYVYIL